MEENQAVSFCRLCLSLLEGNQMRDLNSSDQLCEILKAVFPGMKLDLVPTPKMCFGCVKQLRFAFDFKATIVSNELGINSSELADRANLCRLCLKQQNEDGVVFLYDNNCSYSYQSIRTMTEIATTQLDFEILKKPIMCARCWSVIKQIYTFKKVCFKTEKILQNLHEEENRDIINIDVFNVLSREKDLKSKNSENILIEEYLSGQIPNVVLSCETVTKLEDNKENNDLVSNHITSVVDLDNDDKELASNIIEITELDVKSGSVVENELIEPGDIHSESEESDIFEEHFQNDDVVEIKIKSHKNVKNGTTKSVASSVAKTEKDRDNNDKIVDIQQPPNCDNLLEEVKDEITVEEGSLIKSEVSGTLFSDCEDAGGSNDGVTEVIISSTENISTSEVSVRPTQDSVNTVIPIQTSQKLIINLVDCIKYQLNSNVTKSNNHSLRNKPVKSITLSDSEGNSMDSGNSDSEWTDWQNSPTTSDEEGSSSSATFEKPKQYTVNIKKSLTINLMDCVVYESQFRKFDESTVENYLQGLLKNQGDWKRSNPKYGNSAQYRLSQCDLCQQKFTNLRTLNQHKELVHLARRKFQCDKCQKRFKRLQGLKEHMISHETERKFLCDACQKGFKTWKAVKNHMVVHEAEKKFGCLICHKRFKHSNSLKHHLLVHNSKKKFVCDICQKAFRSNDQLKKHKQIHLTVENFDCDLCSRKFNSQRFLIQHKIYVHALPKFKCDVCIKRFKHPGSLDAHMITHGTDRTYFCGTCRKSFKGYYALKDHISVHETEKKFVCLICQKRCKRADTLRRHILAHSRGKFICDICQIAFKSRRTLTYHKKVVHLIFPKFVCDVCPKSFSKKVKLHNHKVWHSDDRNVICKICSKAFKTPDTLREHMEIHSNTRKFVCEVCQAGFNNASTLRNHKPLHIKCTKCKITYKTADEWKKHQTKHEEEKKFICGVCERRFMRKDVLSKHISKVHV